MTYCVGLFLDAGLVLLSDTRTNAGMDNVSVFGKQHLFRRDGERAIVAMTAGNLAVSQKVVNLVQEGLMHPETGRTETVYSVPSMFTAASLFGEAILQVFHTYGPTMKEQGISFDVSILLGGQVAGRTMRLFQIYAAGNFIAATPDTPFLQIGEHKYGKPILDRVADRGMSLGQAGKLVLLSFDSTLRSNLSVGMPLDLAVIEKNAFRVTQKRRIEAGDPAFRAMSEAWSTALRDGFARIEI